MHKKVRNVLCALLIGSMLAPLAACGNKDFGKTDTSGASGTESKTEGVAPIRWLTTGDVGAKPMEKGDRIVEKIDELLGIDLSVDIVPEASFERINVEMAGANLPDIVTGAFGTSATQGWIDDDLLVELNPYLDSRPDLKKRLEEDYPWTAQDDKYYGVPFITQYNKANTLIVMRQDWLDKLGLEYPKTLDDFKKVMLAFTNDDPDGNGVNDTVGYTDVKPVGNFNWAFAAYGLEHADFGQDKDGKVIPVFETEAYKKGMEFVKDLWEAGAIDKEFMLNDNAKKEEKFYQGKSGAMVAALFRHVTRIEKSLQALEPNAAIAYGLPPAGPDGKFGLSPQGKSGMFTAVTVDSKAPDKAADFLNFMLSKEGNDLLRLGIEGVHYTKDGDKLVMNEEERAKDSFSDNGWAHPLAWGTFYWPLESGYLPDTEPGKDRALESIDLAYQAQIPNLMKQKTAAEMEFGTQLDSLVQQATISYLQGKGDFDTLFGKLGEEWRAQGGDKVLEQVTEGLKEQ